MPARVVVDGALDRGSVVGHAVPLSGIRGASDVDHRVAVGKGAGERRQGQKGRQHGDHDDVHGGASVVSRQRHSSADVPPNVALSSAPHRHGAECHEGRGDEGTASGETGKSGHEHDSIGML